MKVLRLVLVTTFLIISSADVLFAKSYVDRKSDEKIAMMYCVSIVLAGVAIGGGIYLSKKSGKKKNNDSEEKG